MYHTTNTVTIGGDLQAGTIKWDNSGPDIIVNGTFSAREVNIGNPGRTRTKVGEDAVIAARQITVYGTVHIDGQPYQNNTSLPEKWRTVFTIMGPRPNASPERVYYDNNPDAPHGDGDDRDDRAIDNLPHLAFWAAVASLLLVSV